MKEYFVYIMSSFRGTLYTGITSNLEQRLYEHKNGIKSTFASKYKATRLVYFESTSDVHAAIAREKQIKGWSRAKKVALITAFNDGWQDLASDLEDGQIPRFARNDTL